MSPQRFMSINDRTGTYTCSMVQAPGYFLVVKRGMDFSTMRSKVQANEYDIWQTFQVCAVML